MARPGPGVDSFGGSGESNDRQLRARSLNGVSKLYEFKHQSNCDGETFRPALHQKFTSSPEVLQPTLFCILGMG